MQRHCLLQKLSLRKPYKHSHGAIHVHLVWGYFLFNAIVDDNSSMLELNKKPFTMKNAVTGAGWLCMFTPETWSQARSINYSQAALPILRAKAGSRMRPGNKIFAYITQAKKIAGILEVVGLSEINAEQSKYGLPGQFPVIIPTLAVHILQDGHWLDMETLVGRLRLFRGLSDKKYWTMAIRTTPRELSSADTETLETLTRELPCI